MDIHYAVPILRAGVEDGPERDERQRPPPIRDQLTVARPDALRYVGRRKRPRSRVDRLSLRDARLGQSTNLGRDRSNPSALFEDEFAVHRLTMPWHRHRPARHQTDQRIQCCCPFVWVAVRPVPWPAN
jgi:hypothetical protein